MEDEDEMEEDGDDADWAEGPHPSIHPSIFNLI